MARYLISGTLSLDIPINGNEVTAGNKSESAGERTPVRVGGGPYGFHGEYVHASFARFKMNLDPRVMVLHHSPCARGPGGRKMIH